MTFREALNAPWFQVIDGGVIVFEGPLQPCGDYVIANQGRDLIIRPATF